jgi:hypothetical protein
VKWHAFNLARGLSVDYWGLPAEVFRAHQLLLWACAQEENSGIWRDSESWPDRQWLRVTGIGLDEVKALVSAGLARWVTREQADALVADLTPTQAEIDSEDGIDWERCRITSEAVDRHSLSIRSTQLVDPIDTPCRSDRSPIDLCVIDFDLGGQIKAQHISEMKRKAANHRWNQHRQLELLRPPASEQRSLSIGSISDRHTAGDARAMHSYSNRSGGTPPTPPAGGRSRPAEPEPDREQLAQLEGFWAWLLRARPPQLNSALWGGGKKATMRAIVSRANEARVTVGELLEQLRRDLARKFRDPRWVSDWSSSKRGLRNYVRNDDWQTPLPTVEQPRPAEVPETSNPDAWLMAQLTDPAVPEDKKQGFKARWIELHPGQRPPWDEN